MFFNKILENCFKHKSPKTVFNKSLLKVIFKQNGKK